MQEHTIREVSFGHEDKEVRRVQGFSPKGPSICSWRRPGTSNKIKRSAPMHVIEVEVIIMCVSVCGSKS